MTGLSASFAGPVTAAFDTAPYKRIVDVGGGHGNLLRALLGRAPHATGVLFDLPEVAGGAPDALADLPIEIVGGSSFDGVPAGGDLYFLQHVLHDWDDSDVAKILRNCHRAGQPGHTLAVVELCLPERPSGWLPFLLDLHMLVESGGRERTERDFRALLAGAGYELEKAIGLVGGGQHILVARS
jgi:SAM-dependent methyltransferase